ncbi:MAG: OB-fold domain-containing protein [Novosphingobium sp.]|nr:OB-fold domain-containing protein [Novosphingobium sp.]
MGQRTEWQILSAGGTLYSRTRIHVVPEAFIEAAPLDVGIIDHDAGLRFLCWLVEDAQTAPLDSRLELVALRYANGTVFGARPEVTGNA